MLPSTCFGFAIRADNYLQWQFTLGFVILNILLILAIICMCMKINLVVFKSAQNVKKMGQTSGRRSTLKVSFILGIQVAFTLLCWIPLTSVFCLSLFGFHVHDDIINWMTIVIVPINSLTDPFILTIKDILSRMR